MSSISSKLVNTIINYIYHDNYYLISPNVDWHLMNVLNKNFKDNYIKVKPILLRWQEKGYITMVENEMTVFIFHPEKLPTKEQLIEESKHFITHQGSNKTSTFK